MMLFVLGFVSVITQSVLLKELAVLFRNNEIVIGILFFWWMAGSGIGSVLYKNLPDKFKRSGYPALVIAVILQIIMIFAVRITSGFYYIRAELDLIVLFLLSAVFLLPVSLLIGLAFPALTGSSSTGRTTISYFLETSGFFVGGIIFSLLITGNFDALPASGMVLLVCIISVFLSLNRKIQRREAVLLSVMFFLCFIFIVFNRNFIDFSRQMEWRGGLLIESRESKYGNMALLDDRGKTLYYNGKVLASEAYNLTEEKAHIPAMIKGRLENILIIGYAEPGLITELVKYKPQSIVNVFLDERLADFSQKYYGEENLLKNISMDPIIWVKSHQEKFELIILNLPFPDTLAGSRFYSLSFLKQLKNCLSLAGLLAMSFSYEENYLPEETLNNFSLLYNKLKNVFLETEMLPMEHFFLLASDAKMTASENFLEKSVSRSFREIQSQKVKPVLYQLLFE